MNKLLKRSIAWWRFTPEERSIMIPVLQEANLRHIQMAAIIGPLVNLAHIILFLLALDRSSQAEQRWRFMIIALHAAGLAIFLVLGLLARRISGKGPPNGALSLGVSHAFYFSLLLLGATASAFDQLVTPAITPYILMCLATPLIIQLHPLGPLLWLAAAAALFSVLLGFFQADANALLSARLNGITGLSVGAFLSLLLWNFTKTRILQAHQIEEQNRQLNALNQTKDRFFAIIAHDLRSPFSGIMGVLKYLLEEGRELSEEDKQESLNLLYQSSNAVYRLLENLLLWSKSQLGAIENAKGPLELKPFLESVLETFSSTARHHSVGLTLECPKDCVLNVDRAMLETTIRNLVSNGLKFTPAAGRVTVSATEESDAKGKVVRIECRDTGPGIPESVLGSLFRIDKKSVASDRDGNLGSGLGLILCREFVGRMGGILQVASEAGIGTRFWFDLPQDHDQR